MISRENRRNCVQLVSKRQRRRRDASPARTIGPGTEGADVSQGRGDDVAWWGASRLRRSAGGVCDGVAGGVARTDGPGWGSVAPPALRGGVCDGVARGVARTDGPGWGSVAPPGLAAGLPRWTAPLALMFRRKNAWACSFVHGGKVTSNCGGIRTHPG